MGSEQKSKRASISVFRIRLRRNTVAGRVVLIIRETAIKSPHGNRAGFT
jgi:hypothetical protein